MNELEIQLSFKNDLHDLNERFKLLKEQNRDQN